MYLEVKHHCTLTKGDHITVIGMLAVIHASVVIFLDS